MDLTIQAMTGVMHTTGYADRPPVKAGPAIADFFAGIHLYGAIATALFERERTGVVRRLEVAMQDAVYPSLSSSLGLQWGSSGAEVARSEEHTSELQSLMRISYAVFCLKKKTKKK